MRVEPGADRGAAQRDLAEPRECVLHARRSLPHLRCIAAEFLAERDRDCVHPVRAAATSRRRQTPGLRSSDAAELVERGRRSFMISSSAARCTADGKTSFDDWPMLTSSFACTSSPASVAAPRSRSCSTTCPSRSGRRRSGTGRRARRRDAAAAAAMRSALSRSSRPRSAFACAAAPLIRPSQRAGSRDRLARDGEVADRLRGLAAPELPRLRPLH